MNNKNNIRNFGGNMQQKKNNNNMPAQDKPKSVSEKPDVTSLLSSLTPEQAQTLGKILNDKEAANKLLNTPQAQALIKKLSGK